MRFLEGEFRARVESLIHSTLVRGMRFIKAMSKATRDLHERLLKFLLDPRSYPHRPRRVTLVQTHASQVAIAPPLVFKVKKAVNLGFLDFTTLAKRRAACEQEVALNRRLAPDVYLGVVPITRSGSGFAFEGKGEVVEYAVQMRHLDPRYFLNHLLHHSKAGRSELNRVARYLVAFYCSQHGDSAPAEWGGIAKLRLSTNENFRQVAPFVGKTISRTAFDAIRRFTAGFYRTHAALFAERVREGWIRDCHGDLHLEHIHITPRSLAIYDCIEFNDRFRCIDVANDIAFLAMDLDYEHRPDLARHFAARMAQLLDDRHMLRLLDFYKCYRAFVRGKVESFHSTTLDETTRHRDEARHCAERYFRLALSYAVAGSTPTAFVVMGRIGSGKSAIAETLSRELGWQHFSSDRIRKMLAGAPLFDRSGDRQRVALYSPRQTATTYDALSRSALAELRAGRSVILDATFGSRAHRDALRRKLKRSSWRMLFIEAAAPDSVVRARLKRRGAGEPTISDARIEDFVKLSRSYESPRELPANEWVRISSSGAVDTTMRRLLRQLVERQLRSM